MPNYCDNTLEIHSIVGIYDDIISKLLFTEPKVSGMQWDSPRVGGKEFSFMASLPTPEPLRGTSAPARVVTKEELKEFLKRKKKGEVGIWESAPITQAMFNKYLKKYGATDWYHWNIANWGVKWDADVYDINQRYYTDGAIEKIETRIHFTTAWAPPTLWFDHIASLLARLGVYMELRYSESGMGFAGAHYFDEVDRWDSEGRIYMVQDSTGYIVTYDSKIDVWRNEKGNFVSADDIREEYEYDSNAL